MRPQKVHQIVLCILASFLCVQALRAGSIQGIPGIATRHAQMNWREIASGPETQRSVHSPVFTQNSLPVPTADVYSAPLPEEAIPLVPSPSPSAGFAALGDNNTAIPPDTHGAVGPNHLMTTLNSQVRIQDRSGATLSTVTLNSFWSKVGPFGTGVFDPKVVYDPYGGRFIFTACADSRSGTSSLLIGVSQTSDPTGAWNLYRNDADSTDAAWADYPSVGFNKDWVAVQVNMFTVSANAFSTSKIFVFNKSDLYAGGSGRFQVISNSSIGTTQCPALTFDNTLSTLYMIGTWNPNSSGSGYLRLYSITGSVDNPALNLGAYVSTPNPWSPSPQNQADFSPQFGSANKIQANDDRIQNVIYRNGSLWCVHTVFLPAGGSPTRSALQWWQISTTGSVTQRGRIEDTSGATFYAFPSIAVNKNNDALIGFSRFSSQTYASACFALRLGTDASGTFRSETVLKGGEAPYYKTFSGTRNRWGDYSAAMVDPLNDLDLWTIQEYAATPSGGYDRWGTWWGKVSLAPVVSGYVRTSSGAPISGVSMGGLPGTVTTDASGFYSAQLSYGWSGTVTPAKSCYSFSPATISYSGVTADMSGQGYAGTSSTPSITTQPQSRVLCKGQSATFTVVASGSSLSYQWRKNGANIASAKSASYTTSADGTYDCVVSNSCGSVTSSAAALASAQCVSIPQAKSLVPGTTVALLGKTVTASFADFFYIEDVDRTGGIRVRKVAHGLVEGTKVDVSGTIRVNTDGETYVDAALAAP